MSAVNGNYAGPFSLKGEYGSNSRFVGTYGSIANSSKANLVVANSGIFSCITTDKLIANSGIFSTIIADKVIANSGLFSYMSSNKVVLSNLLNTTSLATNSDGLIIAGSGGGGGFTGSNTLFVASNGSDIKGDGTSTNPYQTVGKCITELDGKTVATNYSINFLSDITETTSYSLLPNLNINGNNYRWIDSTIVNDVSKWNVTTNSVLQLNNIIFVNLSYTSDFSTYNGGFDLYTIINTCFVYDILGVSTSFTLNGTGISGNMFYYMQNCYFYGTVSFNITSTYLTLVSSILVNTTMFVFGSATSYYINNIDTFGNGLTINNFSTGINFNINNIDYLTMENNGSVNNYFMSNITALFLTMNDTNSVYYTDSYFNESSIVFFWNSSNTYTTISAIDYINGLNFTTISGTTVTVSSGQCLITSVNNLQNSIWKKSVSTTVNLSVSGLNGLDSGTLAANTWYYIYAIGKVGNTGNSNFIASVSPPYSGGVKVGPVLPFGYLCWKYIGSVKTKTASTNLINVKQISQGNQKIYQWLELDGQNCINDAGGGGSTYDMTPGASLIASDIDINTSFTTTVATNVANIRSNISDTISIKMSGTVVGIPSYSYITISPDSNNQIYLENFGVGDTFTGTIISYTEPLLNI